MLNALDVKLPVGTCSCWECTASPPAPADGLPRLCGACEASGCTDDAEVCHAALAREGLLYRLHAVTYGL